MWTCSLHTVGNVLKDSKCVSYLLLQVSDSSFVSLRRASNLSCDNCADASLHLSTDCSIGCYFHTTAGNKRYSKTRWLTKLTLNSGKASWFNCFDDSTMNCQCSVCLLLFKILLIFACVFCFKYFNMHIPVQHCKKKKKTYTSFPFSKCIGHRLHTLFFTSYTCKLP